MAGRRFFSITNWLYTNRQSNVGGQTASWCIWCFFNRQLVPGCNRWPRQLCSVCTQWCSTRWGDERNLILNKPNFNLGVAVILTTMAKNSRGSITDVCPPLKFTQFVFCKSSWLYQPGKKNCIQYNKNLRCYNDQCSHNNHLVRWCTPPDRVRPENWSSSYSSRINITRNHASWPSFYPILGQRSYVVITTSVLTTIILSVDAHHQTESDQSINPAHIHPE